MNTDIYSVRDAETGEITHYSKAEERDNEMLTHFSYQDAEIKNNINGLKEFSSVRDSFLGTFEEEAEKIIDEVNNLKGALYTREGKNAEIRKRIKQLAEDKQAEASEIEKEYQNKVLKTVDSINQEIYASESLTGDEAAKIALRNEELNGEIKGMLHTITNTQNLLDEYQKLVGKAKYDKGLSRFLQKNTYLFMDRVKELSLSDMEEARAIQMFKNNVEELTSRNVTNRQKALNHFSDKLRRDAKGNYSLNGIKRIIGHKSESYSRKYS